MRFDTNLLLPCTAHSLILDLGVYFEQQICVGISDEVLAFCSVFTSPYYGIATISHFLYLPHREEKSQARVKEMAIIPVLPKRNEVL